VSSADVLLNIATAARLFHATDGTGFADLIIDGHRETWPLRSKRFQTWLCQHYYERTWDAPSPGALNAALNVLEAQAQFDGPQRKVSVRLAEQDGLIYLDLADEFWRCVEIGANGWRIAEDPPVRFRRSAGMQPLPLPARGGSIEALAPFVNVPSDNDFVLVVAWLLGALRAGGPYPILAIAGEQGSAKTVLSKLLRALIDPSMAPVRALPRDERELFIAANNSHVLAFDNLSGLPPWLSDTFCRLTSGGAFSTRRLFTDQDEILFAAARPIILNGIEDIITRPDLADRAILLTLAPIAERQRRPENMLWRKFDLARPYILGALLDAAVHGLSMLPQARLHPLPRMADFALWATACESAFRPAVTFEAAYSNNRRDAIENIIDADPVATCVCEIMAEQAQWTGSASDFLQLGTNRAGWPKGPRALAGRLRRAQTFLRTLGIEIVFNREGRLGTRTITITAIGESRSHNNVSTVSIVSRVSDHGHRAEGSHDVGIEFTSSPDAPGTGRRRARRPRNKGLVGLVTDISIESDELGRPDGVPHPSPGGGRGHPVHHRPAARAGHHRSPAPPKGERLGHPLLGRVRRAAPGGAEVDLGSDLRFTALTVVPSVNQDDRLQSNTGSQADTSFTKFRFPALASPIRWIAFISL
jgi:hypothetical protein